MKNKGRYEKVTKTFRGIFAFLLSAACLASALFLLFPATASAEESGAESLADQIGVFGLTEILGQAYPLWLAIVALALYGGAIVALMAFLIARAAPSEKPAKKQEREARRPGIFPASGQKLPKGPGGAAERLRRVVIKWRKRPQALDRKRPDGIY